ncbi:MAG: site-specific integrase, partial [Gammaproteobacteria bacterium]|nr:site-specific integrase [Gammaproteobacteria bacterium]
MNNEQLDRNYDLRDVYEQFGYEKLHRPDTKKTYRKVVNRFIGDTRKHRVDQISKEVLLSWRDQVVERSSEITYNNYHRHMNAILSFSVTLGLIETNPMRGIRTYPRANTRRKGSKVEDLETFCAFLENDDHPLSPIILNIVLTYFYTGMRRAQLCGLIWRDIDFEDNTILLRKTHSKSGHEWKIAIHENLRPRLLEMKIDLLRRFTDFREDDQVFWIQRYSPDYVGERFTVEQLAGIMKRTSKRSGVKISSHMIRHLVATTLANKEAEGLLETGEIPATLSCIQAFLGHENIATTIGYIEPGLSSQRRVIKGLQLLLG